MLAQGKGAAGPGWPAAPPHTAVSLAVGASSRLAYSSLLCWDLFSMQFFPFGTLVVCYVNSWACPPVLCNLGHSLYFYKSILVSEKQARASNHSLH